MDPPETTPTIGRDGQPKADHQHELAYLVICPRGEAPFADSVRCLLNPGDNCVGRGVPHADPARAIEIADPAVSREHFLVYPAGTPASWRLRDLRSKNGTFVNGARVDEGSLHDGDVVECGNTFLVFRLSSRTSDRRERYLTSSQLPEHLPGLATFRPELEQQLQRLNLLGPSRVPLLITGESGVGKEVLARAVHARSGRAGSFVGVNCGALPQSLLVSELFGFRKGAFSGAHEDRPGLFRASDGGTLLLDEIGELDGAAQVALLRVLQEREVVPLGETRPVKVDLRVIAATNRDLAAECAKGRFRADLLSRISGHAVHLPPLRERREDIPLLVQRILRALLGERSAATSLSRDALARLIEYAWPMNVRELHQTLHAAIEMSGGERIDACHLPDTMTAGSDGGPAIGPSRSRREVRRRRLVDLMVQHEGNISAVAREMDTSRTQISRLLERYGLRRQDFTDEPEGQAGN